RSSDCYRIGANGGRRSPAVEWGAGMLTRGGTGDGARNTADRLAQTDGWNWSTAAYANTYVQKSWLANYSGRNRPYEFEGGYLAIAPSADPQNAYIWDQLGHGHVAYRNYGFWVFGGQVAPTEPELAAHTDLAFPGYDLTITDQTRVNEWLKEFQTYVSAT